MSTVNEDDLLNWIDQQDEAARRQAQQKQVPDQPAPVNHDDVLNWIDQQDQQAVHAAGGDRGVMDDLSDDASSLLEGAKAGLTDWKLGAEQRWNQLTGNDARLKALQDEIRAARAHDAALTGAAKAGYYGTKIGAPILAALPLRSPAALGATGAIEAALEPTLDEEKTAGVPDSVMNPIMGGALSFVGGVAGNKLMKGAKQLLDSSKARLAEKAAQNASRTEAALDAQDRGYALMPTEVNPESKIAHYVTKLAGGAREGNLLDIKNADLTSSLARRALGLPEDADLGNPETFANLRSDLAQHYEPIHNLQLVKPDQDFYDALRGAIPSTDTGTRLPSDKQLADAVTALADRSPKGWTGEDFVEELRRLRGLSNDFYSKAAAPSVADSTRTSNSALGEGYSKLAEAMEGLAERHPDLDPMDLMAYRSARARIARSHDIERAITPEGFVDPSKLAKNLGKAAKLDPSTNLIVNTAKNFPRSVAAPKPGTRSPLSTWDAVVPMLEGMSLFGGLSMHYPVMTGLGGVGLGATGLRVGARHFIPTRLGQRIFASPKTYEPSIGLRIPAAVMRPGLAAIPAEQAGREFFEDRDQP